MLIGALIGVIVALIAIAVRKNLEKKSMENMLNNDLLDTPDYAAFFHYASEATQNKKGIKFFDSNGPLTILGNTLTYTSKNKKQSLSFDISSSSFSLAPEKKKMKWIEIEKDGEKHYFTSFSQGAFKLDKQEMDVFILKLKELNAF